ASDRGVGFVRLAWSERARLNRDRSCVQAGFSWLRRLRGVPQATPPPRRTDSSHRSSQDCKRALSPNQVTCLTGLSQKQEAELSRASPVAVTKAASHLLRYFLPKKRWVGVRNRYASSILKKLDDDLKNKSLKSDQLGQYLAAASVLHCADGWSYLGRAVGA